MIVRSELQFLPTDTVSTITTPDFPGSVVLVIFLFSMLIVCPFVLVMSNHRVRIVATVIMLGSMGGLGLTIHQTDTLRTAYNADLKELKDADSSNFVSNIEAVYDVEVTLPEGDDYSVSPEEKLSVKVVQDGVGYEALVSQNSDTYEPTLVMTAVEVSANEGFRKK